MALTATTLAAACTASDLTLTLTSTTSFLAGQLVKIDDEYMVIVSVPVSGTIVVRNRGFNGTFAEPHQLLAPVITSKDISDFPGVAPGEVVEYPPDFQQFLTIGKTQTLSQWTDASPITYAINAASALTITLPTPSTGLDGKWITFTSNTAYAHVVSASSLIADAVSGSPHSTATFAAYKGAGLTLIISNGLYNINATTGITVT